MLVVGEFPSEIRVSREQYLNLVSRLEAGVHQSCPHEAELAYELIDLVRPWVKSTPAGNSAAEEQLELPLEWPDRAAR